MTRSPVSHARQNACTVLLLVLVGSCMAPAAGRADLREELQEVRSALSKKILPLAQDAIANVEVSTECSSSLFKMMKGVRRFEAWALKCEFGGEFAVDRMPRFCEADPMQ